MCRSVVFVVLSLSVVYDVSLYVMVNPGLVWKTSELPMHVHFLGILRLTPTQNTARNEQYVCGLIPIALQPRPTY